MAQGGDPLSRDPGNPRVGTGGPGYKIKCETHKNTHKHVGGTLSMAFLEPVYAGDRLTVRGRIQATHPEGPTTRVTVEIWIQNQHGVQTAAGTATGLLPT